MVPETITGKRIASRLEEFVNGENGCFGVERVEYGLQKEDVHPSFHQAAYRLGVRGLELVEGDVAEARVVDIGRDRSRAVGGPERAGDEARPRWVLRGELIGCRARELRRLEVELVNEVLQAVVRLRDRGRVEGIGLDHVGARREVLQVDSPDDPGLRQHQQVVVAPEVLRMVGEALSTIVRLREPAALDHGAERPVQDQNALPEQGVELCSDGQP